MSKKHKESCKILNYIDPLLIVISAFASLVGISIGITSSAIVLTGGGITGWIKNYL